MRFEVLAADEKAIVDLLAADFYEESLRLSQARAIEARTGELYQRATPADRAAFRETRRASWNEMSENARAALRDQKRPAFANLTDEQKAPFRTIALDKLGDAGALDEEALTSALAQDI
jgi:hypothetical protein